MSTSNKKRIPNLFLVYCNSDVVDVEARYQEHLKYELENNSNLISYQFYYTESNSTNLDSLQIDISNKAIVKSLRLKFDLILNVHNLAMSRITEITNLGSDHANVYLIRLDLGKTCLIYETVKKTRIVKYSTNINNLPNAVIIDIDGTIAHPNGLRDIYDWAKVDLDQPDLKVLELILYHQSIGDKLLFVTGRNIISKDKTIFWLHKYGINDIEMLLMRESDGLPDDILKKQLYEAEIKDKYFVKLVYEDRQSVVEMWRSLGLKVLQVEAGEY